LDLLLLGLPLCGLCDLCGSKVFFMSPRHQSSVIPLAPSPEATYRRLRRTLTIRHTSRDHVVALIEFISPASKDREASVEELVDKIRGTASRTGTRGRWSGR
jgi:hypothetical protein